MKYFKKLLLIIGVLLFSHYSNACDCAPAYGEKWKAKRVSKEINQSSLVFIGEIISHTDSSYTMKVLDVFKGDVESDTLLGYNSNGSCYNTLTEGIWIIYTSIDKSGKIPEVGLCGLSRNFSEPLWNYPPPPPREQQVTLSYEEYIEAENREVMPLLLKNWMNEYALLSAYRTQHKISESKGKSSNSTLTYVALGIALIALVVALLKNNKCQQGI